MQPESRCDKLKETMGNKGDLAGETRAAELRLQNLFLSGRFSALPPALEEEDTQGGRPVHQSVPTLKKNDVHVIVSCLPQ